MKTVKKIKTMAKKSIAVLPLFTLAGFIFILFLSWLYLSQSLRNNDETAIHGILQNRFQTLITDFVAKRHPEVTQIIFHKLWTKSESDPSEVQIFFSYSLRTGGEAGGDLLVEGKALLKKSSEKKRLWIVQDFQITDNVVNFSEPFLIKAGDWPENS